MDGVGSIGSTGFNYRVPSVAAATEGQSATNQDRKPAGMEGALKLSGEFLKHKMSDVGFVDIQAGGTDKIEMFVQHELSQEEMQIDLDPAAATGLAAYMGSQIAGDASRALQAMAKVDPARAWPLLK